MPSAGLKKLLWTVLSWKAPILAFCLCLSVINQSLALLMPNIEGRMTDAVIVAISARAAGESEIDLAQKRSLVWENLFWVICISAASGLISIIFDNFDSRTDVFLGLHTKNYVLYRIIGHDMSFFAHNVSQKNKMRSRIDGDSKQFPYLIHQIPFQVCVKTPSFIFSRYSIRFGVLESPGTC
jgi:hypothetical protein